MFKQIMLMLGCSCFIGSIYAVEIRNGSFENGLTGWSVKKGLVSVDNSVSAVGKASLRISFEKPTWNRIFQKIAVKPDTVYKLEYQVKCENVVPQAGARIAGAASWIFLKKNTPLRGSQGPWKLDAAPGKWQQVSYTFKTGKDDTKASVGFQLRNASGTIWIDDVQITEVTGK